MSLDALPLSTTTVVVGAVLGVLALISVGLLLAARARQREVHLDETPAPRRAASGGRDLSRAAAAEAPEEEVITPAATLAWLEALSVTPPASVTEDEASAGVDAADDAAEPVAGVDVAEPVAEVDVAEPEPEPDPEPEHAYRDWAGVGAEEHRVAVPDDLSSLRLDAGPVIALDADLDADPDVAQEEPPATEDAPTEAVASVGYGDLSLRYAEQGRPREAALAQWAADLHAAGPLLGRAAPLLPVAQTMATSSSHREAVGEARRVALSMIPEEAAAAFAPADHLADGPVREPIRLPRHQADVTELLEHAEERMSAAREAEPDDQRAAREHARDADLASFEAMLLESALRCGDTGLVTVGLRRDLAALVLDTSDEATAADVETLDAAVDRVRAALRGIAEPHELDALEVAFVPLAAS
ncbi:hypothetical protein [Nocardioides sp. YIM 152588]|uniref:hypothetical protein n=1 Tax=Nocardioides sp. YIM 152588 TaxID=3158259 RepID=UPI0032E3C2D8